MKMLKVLPSLLMLSSMAVFSCCAAKAGITVAGTSDPWLAGMPDGSTASSDDSAPGQSPVLATGVSIVPGGTLTFGVLGSVDNVPDPSGLGPDGGAFTTHSAGAENGISDVNSPVNSLVGVFLDDNQPDGTAAPGALDFSLPGAMDYTSLSPLLKQVFFIGDGLTSSAVLQQVVTPTGATRLYLGTMDGFEWNNNFGAFDVTINPGQTAVPEPGSLALLGTGLTSLMGLRLRKRAAK